MPFHYLFAFEISARMFCINIRVINGRWALVLLYPCTNFEAKFMVDGFTARDEQLVWEISYLDPPRNYDSFQMEIPTSHCVLHFIK